MMISDSMGVLIVERDSNERVRLARELEERGWRVWPAGDSESAIRLHREHGGEIHAALVDLQLPGLEGSRILAELGQATPGLFRCAMSAEVSPYTAAAFRRLTETPLFPKPVQAEQFDGVARKRIHCTV